MAIDISKQISYWGSGAQDDLETAELLIDKGKILEGLFFLHLSLEKALKSLVVKATRQYPPRIHNPILLTKEAKIELSTENQEFMADMNRFCLHGRYPEPDWPKPCIAEATEYLTKSKELASWLMSQ